ncbi:MAG TPA: TIGR03435 family protein [Candidatus Acidoferrales bacterium]|nr:TIGR03435 family protein [Candidatus Acidoferrales bacterium]
MRQPIRGICVWAALATVGTGQTFEVASIKVSELFRRGGEGSRRMDIQAVPGSVTMRNVGVPQAIVWAYKVSPFQITNIQGLDFPDRYDILAKSSRPAKTDEMRVMMQALLAERFKLAVHRETKEMSAYALVEAKGGHKLTPASAEDGPGVSPMQGKLALGGKAATLDQLALFLADPLHAPVIDTTGLKGRYDFSFDLSGYVPQGPRQPGEPEPDPVSILQNALQKQLGLKLEARKMPVEMLVIDHVEKAPVEN